MFQVCDHRMKRCYSPSPQSSSSRSTQRSATRRCAWRRQTWPLKGPGAGGGGVAGVISVLILSRIMVTIGRSGWGKMEGWIPYYPRGCLEMDRVWCGVPPPTIRERAEALPGRQQNQFYMMGGFRDGAVAFWACTALFCGFCFQMGVVGRRWCCWCSRGFLRLTVKPSPGKACRGCFHQWCSCATKVFIPTYASTGIFWSQSSGTSNFEPMLHYLFLMFTVVLVLHRLVFQHLISHHLVSGQLVSLSFMTLFSIILSFITLSGLGLVPVRNCNTGTDGAPEPWICYCCWVAIAG